MVRQGCGFVEEEPDLGRLAIHLLLTAATRTMRQEYLAGLDGFISMPHQAYCYDFIAEWLHSDNIQNYMMWHVMLRMKPVCISALKS